MHPPQKKPYGGSILVDFFFFGYIALPLLVLRCKTILYLTHLLLMIKDNKMKKKLLKLIKLISNNNHRVIPDKGIVITKENINHSMLAKHRDEIGSLCVQLDKVFNHNQDQFETVTEFLMDDEGNFKPTQVERYKKNRKGWDLKESIWSGANTSTDEDALSVL